MLRFEDRHVKVEGSVVSPENGQQVKAGKNGRAGRKESTEASEVVQEKGRGGISEGNGRLAEPGSSWGVGAAGRAWGRLAGPGGSR